MRARIYQSLSKSFSSALVRFVSPGRVLMSPTRLRNIAGVLYIG